MRLETERQGRRLARRVLFKLGKAGTEACRADESRRSQDGALRAALFNLLRKGTPAAQAGFASVLTDAIGTRSHTEPGELVRFYERMEAEARFRERGYDAQAGTGTGCPPRQSRNPDHRSRSAPPRGAALRG